MWHRARGRAAGGGVVSSVALLGLVAATAWAGINGDVPLAGRAGDAVTGGALSHLPCSLLDSPASGAGAAPSAAASDVVDAAAQFAALGSELAGASCAPGPSVGDVQGVVILVKIRDSGTPVPWFDIDAFFNASGTGLHVVRQYFSDVSGGALQYTNYVDDGTYLNDLPEHPGYHLSYRPWAQYHASPSGELTLIVEALRALDAAGFDYSGFDANADGCIDAITVLYTGQPIGYRDGRLWKNVPFVSDEGMSARNCAIYRMDAAVPSFSGVCHETGHMLFDWPDLYDVDLSSAGVGAYCLMAYGMSGASPVHPCACLKQSVGWAPVVSIVGSEPLLWAMPPQRWGYSIYRMDNPQRFGEYFLIENRKAHLRDGALPDSGLAIWHVDEDAYDNRLEDRLPHRHYMVTLVQADGRWDLEQGPLMSPFGDGTDLWDSNDPVMPVNQWTPNTVPDTRWWDGTDSGITVHDIARELVPQDSMRFAVAVERDCNSNGQWDDQDLALQVSLDCNGNGQPDECDLASSFSFDCNSNAIPDECDIEAGSSSDCNENLIPDECELGDPGGFPGVRHGLAGCYYDEPWFGGRARGRIDPTINFNWGAAGPCTALGPNVFASRWTGYVVAESTGLHWFEIQVNNTGRLWVDGQLVVDAWYAQQAPVVAVGSIWLERDHTYRVVMEQVEYAVQFAPGGEAEAMAKLSWYTDGSFVEVVPASRLLPGRDCNGNGVLDTCDIANGVSADVNANGMPDECEALGACCSASGECALLAQERCSGDWQGAGTICYPAQPDPPCPGDCDGDGQVSGQDMDYLIMAIEQNVCGWRDMFTPGQPTCTFWNCDANTDGTVDELDIEALAALIGTACP